MGQGRHRWHPTSTIFYLILPEFGATLFQISHKKSLMQVEFSVKFFYRTSSRVAQRVNGSGYLSREPPDHSSDEDQDEKQEPSKNG